MELYSIFLIIIFVEWLSPTAPIRGPFILFSVIISVVTVIVPTTLFEYYIFFLLFVVTHLLSPSKME